MASTNFQTENNTFNKLMGNGLTYRVPRFQRDYSWTEEEWEDLWLDILGTLETGGEPVHYMGYLVLQSRDNKTFDVIDGQQRLTTLSLLVLAVLKNLGRLVEAGKNAPDNLQRQTQIRQNYIGYLDPVTLVARSKIFLNRNNDSYFQNYLVPLGNLPVRGFPASVHLLRKAFEWFDKRVADYLKFQTDEPGAALAKLITEAGDNLLFTVITVTDELNAYKVFETLNARGVKLSTTDLLKNYLFSVLHRDGKHEHEMKAFETRWESIVGRLGNDNFSDFLRSHWNSRFSFARQNELFKKIRSQIQTPQHAFEFVRAVDADLDTYLAITQPESSQWPQNLKSYASDLKRFGVKQPISFLLAARRIFQTDSDFETLLRSCTVISFRYNVIGNLPPSEQERVYNQVAVKLANQDLTRTSEVLRELSDIYPSDSTFKALFEDKILRTTQGRNTRIVRYILCELEKQIGNADHEFYSDSFNIEHILPQNPGENWSDFSDNQVEDFLYRLGNMTLLEAGANSDLGNADYEAKKAIFAASRFALTRKIAEENRDWTPGRIEAHQKWMAKQAATIWRISQLA